MRRYQCGDYTYAVKITVRTLVQFEAATGRSLFTATQEGGLSQFIGGVGDFLRLLHLGSRIAEGTGNVPPFDMWCEMMTSEQLTAATQEAAGALTDFFRKSGGPVATEVGAPAGHGDGKTSTSSPAPSASIQQTSV